MGQNRTLTQVQKIAISSDDVHEVGCAGVPGRSTRRKSPRVVGHPLGGGRSRSMKHGYKKIRITVALCFLCLLVVGLSIYRDYGISWDEPSQRLIGAVTVKYINSIFAPSKITESAKRLPDLKEFYDRDYGVAFEFPVSVLVGLLRIDDIRDVYMFRHLLTFFVYFTGVYAIYKIATRRFEDWRIGLLTSLFLVITPRLFADGFYNSKDAVFMATFSIAMYTTISFVLKPNFQTAIISSLATAIAIDVRIMATMLLLGSVVILMVRLLRRELPIYRTLLVLGTYLFATSIFVVAMWPWLWLDPLGNFVQAFKNMSKYRWWREVLYMGNIISATQLPWHYSIVWISITTPLLYLALFMVGAFITIRQMCSRGIRFWEGNSELQDIFFLSLFIVPIIAVIVFHSVLYDGWRQLYFIYPAFLLISIKGWVFLWNSQHSKKLNKLALAAVTSMFLMYLGSWMWIAHPMQNVYFNILAGHNIRERYDMDYWGLGNRLALEHILKHDKRNIITVWAESYTNLAYSFYMIVPEDRVRLRYANDKSQPYYILNNYRLVNKPDDSKYSQEYDLFYQLKLGDEIVLSVFKLKEI